MKIDKCQNTCSNCEKASPLCQTGDILCSERGIVPKGFFCKRFSPDPLKRNPENKEMTNIPSSPAIKNSRGQKSFNTPLAPRKGIGAFWREAAENKKYLLFCFFVPALITLLMYICFDIYPLGEGSVLVLDLNGQYVYFFEGLRDIIGGKASLLYSFSRGLGGEFIGIFAYYLSSPFSFIVSLFPKAMITEALLVMFLLKVGACGLTFGIYIEATRKRNRVATVMFSAMYALCGYAVVMQHNTMWTDNLILLPIIMLGVENLIKYGKFKMLVISLAMAVFSNFYIGYMTCIFVFAYYFYYYFSKSPEERNPRGENYHFIRSSLRMALYCVITIAICSALLLCTYYSLTFGKTTFSTANYPWAQKFDWLDMMTKFFIGSYDTVRPEGLPFLYSGTITLILMPLYFFAPHIKTREKIASALLCVLFLVSFNMTKIDLFWHGMQRPNWLNYRYSFMFCFFLILLAYKAFERIGEIGIKKAAAVCASLAGLLIVIQKMGYKNVDDLSTIWLSLGLIILYLCILKAVAANKDYIKRASTLILAIIVSAEMFGAGVMNMNALGLDVVYSTRTSYRNFIDSLLPVSQAVQREDTSFYRMEKTVHRKTNDNFALNMNGLSNSTSTLNSETIKLLNNFGLSSKSHWSKYLGGNPVSDSLFGVKYVITKAHGDEEMELYSETDLGNSDYTVWENPYAMSLAAGVDPLLLDVNVEDYPSPFELMNATVGAMLGEKENVSVFTPALVEEEVGLENMLRSVMAGHIKYAPASGYSKGRVTYTIHVTTDDVLYLFIPSLYPRECYIYLNGVKNGSFFANETDRIVELGSFEVGNTVTVTFENVSTEMYFMEGENFFYYLNSDAFASRVPALSDSAYMIHEYSDDHFKGTINITKGNTLLYTSIPYDEGWKVTADGKELKPVKLLSGLLGFEISEGEHVLEMKYRPDCLYIGLAISIAGLLAFAAAWIITELYRKRAIESGCPVFREEDQNIDLPVIPEKAAFEKEDENSANDENEPFADLPKTNLANDENKSKYPPAPSEEADSGEKTGENEQ
ncbi:MAG: hypothetical protein E7575_00680 [Ruminococcaceae bacterium]|nr:hypothetical protein [Oscillospiraceae bacterium]